MFDALPLPGGSGVMLNTTGIFSPEVYNAVMQNDVVMGQIMRFTTETGNANTGRKGVLADRDRYIKPDSVFDQIGVARTALHDDIVSGVAEETEALAFTEISMAADNEDRENIWDQILADMNIDRVMRVAWSLLFSDSQFVAVTRWKRKDYAIRGKTETGQPRRKTVTIDAPIGISFFDTRKVTPIGDLQFNDKPRLAYIAGALEAGRIEAALKERETLPFSGSILPYGRSGGGINTGDLANSSNEVIRSLIRGRYEPTDEERQELAMDGVGDVQFLYEFFPDCAWRHSLTRPDFMRFARVRMTSVFELLDLKNLLHQMDRAHLIGGANFIVLVTKGSDKLPADPAEIRNLRENATRLGEVPIVVGDHRLHIEIITAKVDVTLNKDRYDVIDQRIAARLYQAIMPTQPTADPMKVAKLVATGLESRRKMLRLAFEEFVVDACRERNSHFFTDRATVTFSPASIQLSFDPAWANALIDLSDGHNLSRDTLLAQFGLNEAREMQLRIRAAGGVKRLLDETKETAKAAGKELIPTSLAADDVFKPTNSAPPMGKPEPAPGEADPVTGEPPRAAVRKGGRRAGGTRGGGGAAPGTNQGGARQNSPEDMGKAKPTKRADRAAAATKDDDS